MSESQKEQRQVIEKTELLLKYSESLKEASACLNERLASVIVVRDTIKDEPGIRKDENLCPLAANLRHALNNIQDVLGNLRRLSEEVEL